MVTVCRKSIYKYKNVLEPPLCRLVLLKADKSGEQTKYYWLTNLSITMTRSMVTYAFCNALWCHRCEAEVKCEFEWWINPGDHKTLCTLFFDLYAWFQNSYVPFIDHTENPWKRLYTVPRKRHQNFLYCIILNLCMLMKRYILLVFCCPGRHDVWQMSQSPQLATPRIILLKSCLCWGETHDVKVPEGAGVQHFVWKIKLFFMLCRILHSNSVSRWFYI